MELTMLIKTEDDAWKALQAWVDGDQDPYSVLDFDGWPKLEVKINGEGYSSSLRSGQMAALLDFRHVMGRSYAAIAHGAYDARRLRKAEEDQLDLNTRVRKGSSIFETDLTPLVNALAQIVSSNPTTSIGAALILGLAFVARPVILKHLENKAKALEGQDKHELMQLVSQLSEQDEQKNRLLDKAISKLAKQHPQVSQFLPEVSTAFWRLAGSAANADTMNVGGVDLNSKQLDVLAERRSQRFAEYSEREEEFEVLGIVKVGATYRVQLKSSTLHISASFGKSKFSESKTKSLMACMTTSKKIWAKIEIKTVDKSQVTGRLLTFQVVKDSQTGT
jgi:hypothetical protein